MTFTAILCILTPDWSQSHSNVGHETLRTVTICIFSPPPFPARAAYVAQIRMARETSKYAHMYPIWHSLCILSYIQHNSLFVHQNRNPKIPLS